MLSLGENEGEPDDERESPMVSRVPKPSRAATALSLTFCYEATLCRILTKSPSQQRQTSWLSTPLTFRTRDLAISLALCRLTGGQFGLKIESKAVRPTSKLLSNQIGFGNTLDRLEHDGLFANLPVINYGIPSSSNVNICVRRRAKAFDMLSAHELFEASGTCVAESHGIAALRKRPTRLQILSEQPSDWLFSRMVWLELRALIDHLVPRDGTPVAGNLAFVTATNVSWVYRPLLAEP